MPSDIQTNVLWSITGDRSPSTMIAEFENLVYITRATENQFTDPPNWVNTEYNTTFLSVGDSIMPDWSSCGCDYEDIFFSNEGPVIHPEYEVKDPVCFPLKGLFIIFIMQ